MATAQSRPHGVVSDGNPRILSSLWWRDWFVPVCWLAWAMPSLLRMVVMPGVAGQDGQHLVVGPAALWLFLREFPRDAATPPRRSNLVVAALGAIVTVHLLAVAIDVLYAELLMVFAAAVVLLYRHGGVMLCRRMWFPLLFAFAALPLPRAILDPATRSLKLFVAEASVYLMACGGYDVARSGSIMFIDQYELVVESACSGVNSIISLVAVGLLYTYLRGRTTPARVAVLLLSTLPVAVAANILRVVLLGVMASHWGVFILDTPLHMITGLAMFVAAVLLLFLVDALFAAAAGLVPAHFLQSWPTVKASR